MIKELIYIETTYNKFSKYLVVDSDFQQVIIYEDVAFAAHISYRLVGIHCLIKAYEQRNLNPVPNILLLMNNKRRYKAVLNLTKICYPKIPNEYLEELEKYLCLL